MTNFTSLDAADHIDQLPEYEPHFAKPLPSRASRVPSPRSKASSRGHVPSRSQADTRARIRHFESKREQDVLFLLLADSNIVDIWDQPPPIRYVDQLGKWRYHTFDWLVAFADGKKRAVAYKPFEVAARLNFRATLQRIRAATPLPYADEVVLITERSFTPAAARNAQKLFDFRRTPDLDADQIVADLIRALTAPMTIEALTAGSGLGGRGYRAAFRAIYAGLARCLDEGDILPSSMIAREVM